MSVQRMVQTACGALLAVMLVCALVFTLGINSIRIGGGHERELRTAGTLEADLLPPPLFVVEAYAVAMEGINHHEKAKGSIERLRALRKDYETRKAFWKTEHLDEGVRAAVQGAPMEAGDAFWRTIDETVIPALQRNDPAQFDSALDAMFSAYHRQYDVLAPALARVATYREAVEVTSKSALTWTTVALVGLGVLLFAGLIGLAWMVLGRVVRPLVRIAEATSTLAEGGEAAVPYTRSTNELGSMARSVDHFRRASVERAEADRRDSEEKRAMVESLADILNKMASGDLRRVLEVEFKGDYRMVGDNLNQAIQTLRAMIQEVVFNGTSIRSAAGEISAASQDLSERTQSNAAAIEETTAALANVDSRIVSTRDAAESTAQSASRAKTAVDQGRSKAQLAAATMEEVRASAASVDGVMEALDKIAFQTRVLAMNAAVEAGHAGEAGKGFAVVADLVSQLAGRAEEEARKAREQLTATAVKISQAVDSVGEVEQEFAGIVDDVASVTELVEQLSEDARAQASAVTEISAAMRQMDVSTQQNAAMVEQTSAAAGSLLADAQKLVDQAETFKWDRREKQRAVPFERRGKSTQEVASINAVHAGQAALQQRLSDAA